MAVEHLFAGIPVSDLDVSVEFYERVFGRPPDLVPNDREAAWRVTDSAWVCLYGGVANAASAPHTLLVDDLDGFLGGVAERGILAGPVEAVAPSVRQSVIADPDGNRLKVGQVQAEPAGERSGRRDG
ncbi:MAG TPA: VOC family protein [Solirubrobacteraceae bacterium]|nr:VOC family protein [Acidimicrobiales bacterium]HTY95555.1 VOC family protein [Solirubrobacteraceae bacterium]